jgi:pyruvate dehydrogenase E1 component alpha subunit
MAALWNLPAVFVIEDNKYGMGTSTKRSSASEDYFSRGDYIPGILADGMDVMAVKSAAKYAKNWAINNGPVILHMSTYRYYGHSMSDPGTSYRTREEVKDVRTNKDPIQLLKQRLIEKQVATAEELKAIELEVRQEVTEAVQFATDSPVPDASELTTNIYTNPNYSVKGIHANQIYKN